MPVEEDGSALFEVPAGKAIYLQALDAEGRVVRSMRSFIQAAPGTTRSCVGCHEDKQASFQVDQMTNLAQRHPATPHQFRVEAQRLLGTLPDRSPNPESVQTAETHDSELRRVVDGILGQPA